MALYGSSGTRLIAFCGVGFFGVLGIPMLLYGLMRPRYLLLDEDGFEMPLTGKRVHRSRWVDIAEFGLGTLSGNRVVTITYRPHAEGDNIWQDMAQQISGTGGVINAMYGWLKVEQLHELLESYRIHYSGRR